MALVREKIKIDGRVQGVGFRPFVFHLAQEQAVNGFVYNSGSSVIIEAEGPSDVLDKFRYELKSKAPINSHIEGIEVTSMAIRKEYGFAIVSSQTSSESLYIPHDLAVCRDCLEDMQNPQDRRFGYPFTHCAVCGPRWCLLEAMPYDRANTTMRDFPMCEICNQEYSSPENRRFHAQTISCPQCGPTVFLLDHEGHRLGEGSDGITQAAQLILQGQIVAVKGVGGFQLWCRADRMVSVQDLRRKKRRPQRPFALMVPDIKAARELCELSPTEEKCLQSIEAPIVLLERKPDADQLICSEVAPGLSELGLMLPCTPLHYLLMNLIQVPVVATSANLSNEPLAYENDDALLRLKGIADFFLADNRKIVRAVDDSVLRFCADRIQLLRLARGYAPAVFHPAGLEENSAQSYGADLKSSLCFQKGKSFILSQHLGELASESSILNFQKSYQDFSQILCLQNSSVTLRDFHPDLVSSRLAPVTSKTVQHHIAHFFSAFIEHQIKPPTFGIIWDGMGLGLNHEIWGGEFFYLDADSSIQRFASLRPFRLIGGDFAMKDTRRIAFSLLKETRPFEDLDIFHFTEEEKSVWSNLSNAHNTTSMGRLFDGVRALISLGKNQYRPPTYEGEHAIQLEELAKAWRKTCDRSALKKSDQEFYSYELDSMSGISFAIAIDWRPLLNEMVCDILKRKEDGAIADKFQRTLIKIAASVIQQKNGATEVVLAGGCFQNRFLLNEMSQELRSLGYTVYWPEQVPIHDGGISAGQLYFHSRSKI